MDPWPKPITNRFRNIPPNPRENDFYGPYNKLLNTLFPVDSDYTVSPQTYSLLESRESFDFIVEFEVQLKARPVFFLEIKGPGRLSLKSSREEADVQMRKRMGDLAPICPLDTLHGVSACGTRLAFYSYEKKGILFFPVASFLTQNWRPTLLLEIAGTAIFWKAKEQGAFLRSFRISRQSVSCFKRCRLLVMILWVLHDRNACPLP